MTIDIRAPDGTTARFPDGTADSVILDVMRREYGGPDAPTFGKGTTEAVQPDRRGMAERIGEAFTGTARTEFPDAPEFGAALTEAARARGTGTSNNLAIVSSLVTPDPNAQLDILRKQIPGLEHKQDVHGNIMLRLPSEGVSDWTYLNRPGMSARDAGEFGAQTLATLPLVPLFGAGASIAARTGTGALAGAGGSIALDAAATAAGSEQGVDPGRALVSGAIGGVLGPLTPRTTTRGTAPAPTPGQEAVQAAERLNATAPAAERIEIPRAVASDSRTVQALGGATRLLPMGDPMQAATQRVTAGLGTAAERTAGQLGGGAAASPFSAGSTARESLIDWITRGSKAESAVGYTALDKLIAPQTLVPLSRTRVAAQGLDQLDVMSASRDGQKVIDLVREAVNRPQGLTYEGLKELRTRVGERLYGDIAPEQGVGARALNRMYGALTEDLRFGVQRAGVAKRGSTGAQALAAFNAATAEHARLSAIKDRLKTIVGVEGEASAERVFDRLIQMSGTRGNADLTKLALARDAIQKAGPGKWEEVASAVVARLGRDREDAFSPSRFLTAYGKMEDAGKNVLFGGNVGVRQALDDIATVSSRFEKTISRYANPSGTGRAVTTVGGLVMLASSPLTALQTAVGGYGLALWLARPVTAKAIAKWTAAYTQAATRPAQATMLLLEQASRQLSEAMQQEGQTTGRRARQ